MEKITYKDLSSKTAKGVVIIDVYADWCQPCKRQAEIFDNMGSVLKEEKVTIYKMDLDKSENKAIAFKYSFQSIPTMLIFKDGEMTKKLTGIQDETQIKYYLKN